ncbi:MAG: geranylgeranylglycerol-phosphate geranylgeranyltransferase [Chloroherpetonaceae bacterium]|nr:geranylgeranylglycerol-phosphate geranylgeranyltransferase [Chloroherpetonaceae bacterium]MDW8436868.1 geranylgeranylglycerol-phosphate geranylgeranyltransferase [Chloroherpetonaceae bacterium]
MPYLELLRPSNIVILFFGTLLGAFVAVGNAAFFRVETYLAGVVTILVGGAGNVINDYFDVEIDRINKPHRPLARGALTRTQAFRYWLVLNVVALVVASFLTTLNLIMALFTIPTLYVYSRHLKRALLVGNLVISALVSLGFLYGAASTGKTENVFYPTLFSFLLNFGRELLKDLEDVEGDGACGADTIPIRFGATATLALATLSFAAMIGATVAPFWTGEYGVAYFLVVTLGTNLPLIYATAQAWRNPTKQNLYRQNTLLKVAMAFGIASVALGKV